MNKFILPVILFFILYCIFIHHIGKYIGFGINQTNSQPPGIYIYYPIISLLKNGDLVDCYLDFSDKLLFWLKNRNYINNNKKLLKKIGAVPGDYLYTFYPNIYICKDKFFNKNCKILSKCLNKDKNNLPVFCKIWNAYKIPDNFFYLYSNRDQNSLDSRYFGLVNIKNIKHKLRILVKY